MTRSAQRVGIFTVILSVAFGFGGCEPFTNRQTASSDMEPEKAQHAAEESANPADEHAEGLQIKFVKLPPGQIEKFGITTASAGAGILTDHLKLPGEVRLDADHVARIVPRLSGLVTEIRKTLGDDTAAGETVAVIESRDLATAVSEVLACRERRSLAKVTFERERVLWEKKISAEQDYLNSKQSLGEAEISLRAAEQALLALGLGPAYLKDLSKRTPDNFTRFEVVSPIAGTIIEKQVMLGDSLQADTAIFTVADLRTVWIDLTVPAKSAVDIHLNQEVEVVGEADALTAQGHISYVGPTVDQDNRAALARVLLPNARQEWKPGMFFTGLIAAAKRNVGIMVSKDAVSQLGGKACVFVKHEEAFEPRPVVLGAANEKQAEILSGLSAGEEYAVTGVFLLKAELEKSAEEE